jgi:hypothetical protein
MRLRSVVCLSLLATSVQAHCAQISMAFAPGVLRDLDASVGRDTPKVVGWRRDIREHPELSITVVGTTGSEPGSVRANHSALYGVDDASFPTGIDVLNALARYALARGITRPWSMK